MKVAFKISANGKDVTGGFKDRLTDLTITDAAGIKSDVLEITVDDREGKVEMPKVGAILDIALGFRETGLISMGKYVVDEISGEIGPDSITISAKAADMLGGIRSPRTRNWNEVTVQDIVGKIAGEYGLKPVVSDSLKSQFFAYIAQTTESDLNLLTRLAKDLDATAKPVGGSLAFVKRGENKSADGSPLPVFDIDRNQISTGSWSTTGRGRYGKVICEWAELGTATVHKAIAGSEKPELKLRHRFPTKVEAERAAQSALERSKRGSAKINIRLGGFYGALLAEGFVNLTGLKSELNGRWLVNQVQHTLGSGGLVTIFDAERDNEKAGS